MQMSHSLYKVEEIELLREFDSFYIDISENIDPKWITRTFAVSRRTVRGIVKDNVFIIKWIL